MQIVEIEGYQFRGDGSFIPYSLVADLQYNAVLVTCSTTNKTVRNNYLIYFCFANKVSGFYGVFITAKVL